jgi:hypothetical protein
VADDEKVVSTAPDGWNLCRKRVPRQGRAAVRGRRSAVIASVNRGGTHWSRLTFHLAADLYAVQRPPVEQRSSPYRSMCTTTARSTWMSMTTRRTQSVADDARVFQRVSTFWLRPWAAAGARASRANASVRFEMAHAVLRTVPELGGG